MTEDGGPWNERFTAIVAAESLLDTTLVLYVHPVDIETRIDIARTTLTVTVWRENDDVVRMSLRNPATTSIAYLQSGGTLVTFARELGFDV